MTCTGAFIQDAWEVALLMHLPLLSNQGDAATSNVKTVSLCSLLIPGFELIYRQALFLSAGVKIVRT